MIRSSLMTLALCLVLLTSATTQAPEMELRAVILKHAAAQNVSMILTNLFAKDRVKIMADPRTNQVLLYGEKAILDRISGKMIATLDVPSEEAGPTVSVILPVKHRPVTDLSESIRMHMSRQGQFALDKVRNAVVIQDAPPAIQKVRETLKALDVAPASLNVHFMILGRSDTPLPETPVFRDVKRELDFLGLAGFGVIGRASVRTVEGSSFSASGAYASPPALAPPDRGMAQLSGQIRLLNGSAELALRVTVAPNLLNTTLVAPLEDLVLIGLTPSAQPGNTLVLAVRIFRTDLSRRKNA